MSIAALITAIIVAMFPNLAVWPPFVGRVLSATLIVGLSSGKLADWIASGFIKLSLMRAGRLSKGKSMDEIAKLHVYPAHFWTMKGQFIVGIVVAIVLAWALMSQYFYVIPD